MLSRSPICSCCEKHRPPRRRSYSDSRSFHRPGRPDSRHHRDPRQVTPQRHGTGFRFPAPRGQGTQRGRGHGGYHRGRVKGIDLPRRKSSGRDVGSLTFAGMRRLDLAFHIATKLNRSHLLVARTSLILPCLGRTDLDTQESGPQAVTVEGSTSMVHASRGFLKPLATWSDPKLRYSWNSEG